MLYNRLNSFNSKEESSYFSFWPDSPFSVSATSAKSEGGLI